MTIQIGLLADYEIKVKNKTPLRERPAYRATYQPEACTLAELLTVITGSEEAGKALVDRFSDAHTLARAHVFELTGLPGVGPQMAVRIKAALTLASHLMREKDKISILCPQDAYNALRPYLDGLDHERLAVLVCNTRNRVEEVQTLYQGTANSSQVRIAELFRRAIQTNNAAVVLGHNHPSGDPTPSAEDLAMTRAAIEAGKMLDIDVLDHIVVGGGGRYISMKEKGMAFR